MVEDKKYLKDFVKEDNLIISNHAYDRYAERFDGIVGPEVIADYVEYNKDLIRSNIYKMAGRANYIMTDNFFKDGDDNKLDYYVSGGNVGIAVGTDDRTGDMNVIVTIFPIEWKMGEEISKTINNDLINRIFEIDAEIDKKNSLLPIKEEELVSEIDGIEYEIDKKKQEIQSLERDKGRLLSRRDALYIPIEELKKEKHEKGRLLFMLNGAKIKRGC